MQQAVISGFRLSPQQGRLWFLQQDSPAYRAQCTVRLAGCLNPAILREALQRVVQRHEILRTTFRSLPGMTIPVQVIHDHATPAWQEMDWQGCSTAEQETRLTALLQAERQSPIDFTYGPLLRVSLLAFAADAYVMLLSLPALCADAWSLRNLVQEISQAYAAWAPHEAFPEEPLQYVQFSEWQHELLNDAEAETGKAYWRQQNIAAVPALTLPVARQLPGGTAFASDSVALELDHTTVAQLEALAAQHHTSAAVCLLACWQVLLWRLTGCSDVVVGTACDGRAHEALYSALGLFAKWVPIRGQVPGHVRYSDLLSQIHDARREAYEWQDYFLWEENTAEAAFFPIGFEWEAWPAGLWARQVSFTVCQQDSYTERFTLKLSCGRVGEGLRLAWHYDLSQLQRTDVDRVAQHFVTLLSSVMQNPQTPVSRLEILGVAERQHLLVASNATAADFPQEACIQQLFEAQVERTPHRPAVVCEGEGLSYAELNARANQLAHHLRRLGVGPEVVVGLCVERSPAMLVGLLGILKAGGAYLPLDLASPQERLAFMMADTRAPVLVTQERLVPGLPTPPAAVVCLDADRESIALASTENPVSGAVSQNLAYVIYTSGSTGTPKGVMIQHRSAVNLATALQRTIYAQQQECLRVSLNAPLTFDASVKQVLQLLSGHTLYILPEEVRPDGQALLSYLRRHAVDVVDCTPAQLRLMLAAGLTQQVSWGPRRLLVGGEALDETTWTSLATGETPTGFYNVYGPTECTVDATVCSVQAAPSEPTIGRPLSNVQIYILDEALQPVPIGVQGELYIGGAGVARGYVNSAAFTAEKFLPHPFTAAPGARLYKTGDAAAYLPDGNIKFLGRRDQQVKIRGYRIELGEVEAVLGQHPAVQEAVVMVREDVPGDLRLVGYVVTRQGSGAAVAELRSYLREKLPEYMIPSPVVRLEKLPLTRNGKVDRRALPVPESVQQEMKAAYVAPRTQIERTMVAVWQEVLQVEKVGVDDNFFDLGGHSLLMVKLHSTLCNVLETELSLIDIFRNPTISSLSKALSEHQGQQPAFQHAMDRASKRKSARDRHRRVQRQKGQET